MTKIYQVWQMIENFDNEAEAINFLNTQFETDEFAKIETIETNDGKMTLPEINERLEYLRGEIKAERISQGELIELQSLCKYIQKNDVELLEWAGVPEFPEEGGK